MGQRNSLPRMTDLQRLLHNRALDAWLRRLRRPKIWWRHSLLSVFKVKEFFSSLVNIFDDLMFWFLHLYVVRG